MFNKNFFPTPQNVIDEMLNDVKFGYRKTFLEPSAGKGNILDAILKKEINELNYYRQDNESEISAIKSRIFSIEINPDLRGIIESKGYSVIDYDFLEHQPDRHYDYIIINPPFDDGIEHFIKAVESFRDSEVICLQSSSRLEQALEHNLSLAYALRGRDFEVTNLGQCFEDAERKTRVEVSIIKVKKDANFKKFSFEFDIKAGGEKHFGSEGFNPNTVEVKSFESRVIRFNKMLEIQSKIITLQNELAFYSDGVIGHKTPISDYDEFANGIRTQAWEYAFSETNLADITTEKVKQDLLGDKEKFKKMSFTARNLYSVFGTLLSNVGEIRKKCIQDAFDELTRYHKDNVTYKEGWKTNKSWLINQKCILPFAAKIPDARFSTDQYVDINYKSDGFLRDLHKALCFVGDIKYKDYENKFLPGVVQLKNRSPLSERFKYGEWYDSYFFEWKAFKKGTMHIKFKDTEILKRFNQEAAEGRNWVGGKFE